MTESKSKGYMRNIKGNKIMNVSQVKYQLIMDLTADHKVEHVLPSEEYKGIINLKVIDLKNTKEWETWKL